MAKQPLLALFFRHPVDTEDQPLSVQHILETIQHVRDEQRLSAAARVLLRTSPFRVPRRTCREVAQTLDLVRGAEVWEELKLTDEIERYTSLVGQIEACRGQEEPTIVICFTHEPFFVENASFRPDIGFFNWLMQRNLLDGASFVAAKIPTTEFGNSASILLDWNADATKRVLGYYPGT